MASIRIPGDTLASGVDMGHALNHGRSSSTSSFYARFLQPYDLPSLLELEHLKWQPDQAATPESLLQRIHDFPTLSIGAFCRGSGKLLASLFMRPIDPEIFDAPTKWNRAANAPVGEQACKSKSLFGISLSSSNAQAVNALFNFYYPYALKAGWQDIYLGSPIPGFRQAHAKNPSLSASQYVHAKRKQPSIEPLDPQLRYYFNKQFNQVVSIQADYFPHDASWDYGVILRAEIPLARLRILWKVTPLRVLQKLADVVLRSQ